MPRSARLEAMASLLALTVLASCARQGPPAPVVMGGDTAQQAAPAQILAPSNATPAAPAPLRPPPIAAPIKSEPARTETATVTPPPPPTPLPNEKAKASPPSPPQTEHPDAIVVGKGETLYMIARRYDLPVRAVIDANHLDPPYQLAAGTRLILPKERFHTVQGGETLYSVSRLYGVELSTLASINHLSEPYAIRSGQKLALPASVLPAETTEKNAAVAPPAKPEPPPAPPQMAEPAKPAPAVATEPSVSKPRLGKVFAWPIEGRIIEGYGTGPTGTHNDGINIAARSGEPVRAAEAGRVAYAGNELRGYGNLILIKHAGGYMTAYAHNARLLVKRGQMVKRGQEIAVAGATGTVSSPQLHFEIRRGTHALDPTNYLPDLRASATN